MALTARTIWSEINVYEPLTKGQLRQKESWRKTLIKNTYAKLVELVTSKEVKNMLDNAEISVGKHDDGYGDSTEILLTRKGIFEKRHCSGHKSYDMADCVNWDYCSEKGKLQVVESDKWPSMIEKFQIDGIKIVEVITLLQS